MQVDRRHFIGMGASAAAALLAGCSGERDKSSSSPSTTFVDPTAGRTPDVVAAYTAGPVELDLAGTLVSTWGYSDAVPGKLLRARAGDLVQVTIDNALEEATSVHWHGLAIVNAMDGVPGLTQLDIEPGASFVYRFVVPDPGTYWFHPHHGLQLDRGLYAPLIIDDPQESSDVDAEFVLVLDDWLDGLGTTPDEEFVRIREMGASMDHSGDGMGGMEMATSPLLGGDAGDAVYPYHLINGRPIGDPLTLEPRPRAGDRVRLRIVNAGSDTAYRVAVGGHKMTVTHSDGFPVVPFDVDAFIIGMGERYDVTIDVRSGAWPVIALAEGKAARAAAVLRTVDATETATPDLEAAISELDGDWLRYADMRATASVALSPPSEIRQHTLKLTGGMGRYDWGIDGRPFGEHTPIEVEHGEWLSLKIQNDTTMWHPIHLHGHTPQLGGLSGGARKDTVNVLPGVSVDLTFPADNPGNWMLHCHNAYHLESGMATVLSYTT